MNTVGSHDARTHFSRLLKRAQQGESTTITRRGVPVAVLAPPPAQANPDPVQTIDAIREYSKHLRLNGPSIRDMIENGRR